MDFHDIKAQILSVACDKAMHHFVPRFTNKYAEGEKTSFRTWDEPFGFSFNGVDIEVHVKLVFRRMKGTALIRKVQQISVWGVCKDGRLHLIQDKVYPTEWSWRNK
jgi:hypothetical protein